jgi:hypothetical protein
VDFVSVGVSISTKSCFASTSRAALFTWLRSRSAEPGPWRRRSRYRYLSRISSFTGVAACSSTGNGNGSAEFSTSTSDAITSISPVGRFGFALPSGRAPTSPVIFRQNSARSGCATSSSRMTTWTVPLESRRSMNATPP